MRFDCFVKRFFVGESKKEGWVSQAQPACRRDSVQDGTGKQYLLQSIFADAQSQPAWTGMSGLSVRITSYEMLKTLGLCLSRCALNTWWENGCGKSGETFRCADLQSLHNNLAIDFAIDFLGNEDFIKELEQQDKLTELPQSDEGTGVADRFHDSSS